MRKKNRRTENTTIGETKKIIDSDVPNVIMNLILNVLVFFFFLNLIVSIGFVIGRRGGREITLRNVPF